MSVANCLGRVLIGKCKDACPRRIETDSLSLGMIADFAKNQLQLPRSLCISLVAALFIISQLAVYKIDHVSDLWKGSALLGLAYGGMFGLFPTIVIEWFGLRGYFRLKHLKLKLTFDPTAHFSENWGFVSLSPVIGGNVFSIAFGRNLDAHNPGAPEGATRNSSTSLLRSFADARADVDSDVSHQCLQGRECYASSLLMTTAACSFALLLALYAGWKDYRMSRHQLARGRSAHNEVSWESGSD